MSNPYAIIDIPEWPEVRIEHDPNKGFFDFPWRAFTVVDSELVNTSAATERGARRLIRRKAARASGAEPKTIKIITMKED